MDVKRIVLPGTGTPTTFTPQEDSTLGVFTCGRIIKVALKANQPTRIEFVNSLASVA